MYQHIFPKLKTKTKSQLRKSSRNIYNNILPRLTYLEPQDIKPIKVRAALVRAQGGTGALF